jgi:hypothetical protein
VKQKDGVTKATFLQHLLRSLMLYVLETGMAFMSSILLGYAVYLMSLQEAFSPERVFVIITSVLIPVVYFWWIAHCSRRYHTLPHSHYTHTMLVPIPVSVRIRNRDNEND